MLSGILTPNKLRRWLLIILVGLASLGSYWTLEVIRSHNSKGASTEHTRPDYFIDNFNFVRTLPNGQSKYRIVGAKLVHYSIDDHADITLPVIINLDPSQSPMMARAQRGIVKNIADQSQSELHLYDKVVLNRPKTQKAEHLQLNTDYLLAFPDKNTIETDFPVEIISGNTVTTGIGLTGDNATEQIRVLSQVYSIINTQKKPNEK